MKTGKFCNISEDFVHGENFVCGDSVIIEKDVKVGNNVKMGNSVIIQEGTRIGDNAAIEHFVLLKASTKVGDNVFIDSYVKTSGHNTIGNNVTLRFNSTIAREVTVEDGCYISPNVMTIYVKHTGEKMGGTVIGANTFVGTNVVLGPAVKIAPNSVIGAMAYVSQDCTEPGMYVGIPARKKKTKL
jgi:UDP-N-acetylglucosamine acyltransferase